ncbi:MAG: acylphosphatase [bacterium]
MHVTRVHLFVSGRVQGVCFRYATQRQARNLNLSGWVKNLYDGRVEIVAEGDEGSIADLVQWAHHGPSGALVKNVQVTHEEYLNEFDHFTIEF